MNIMLNRLLYVLMVSGCFSGISVAGESITLKNALSIAEENNAKIISVKKDVEIAKAGLVQSCAYPNPSLDIKVEDFENTGYELGINQELELFRKRAARKSKAHGLIMIANEQLRLISLDVAMEVKKKYYELLLGQKRTEIAVKNLDLVRKLFASVQDKYNSGAVYLNELLRAKIELSQAENEAVSSEKEMQVVKSQLNFLLGRPVNSGWMIGSSFAYVEKKLDYSVLLDKAFMQNPELKIKLLSVGLGKKEVSLSKLAVFPNPAIGVIYTKEGENKLLGASVGFSMPFWYRNAGEIKEKEAGLEKAENDFEYFKKQLELDLYGIFTAAESAAKRISTLKNNIEEVVEIQNLIDIQYKEGKSDFLTYLDNVKTVRTIKLSYYEAIADYETKIAVMERIIGENIE